MNDKPLISFDNNEKEFWILLKEDPKSIIISQELYNNEAFIIGGIKNIGGWFLQYASEELRKNKELIKFSLEYNGRLNYLPNEIRTDLELVSNYLQKTQNLNLCSTQIASNKNLVIKCLEEVIEKNKNLPYKTHEKHENIRKIIRSMNPDFFYDEKIQQMILLDYVDSFKYAPSQLRNNQEEMLKAIKINPLVMKFACRNFKDNREYALIALEKAKEMNIELYEITSYCSKRIRKIIGKSNPLENMKKWLLKDNLENNLRENLKISAKFKV